MDTDRIQSVTIAASPQTLFGEGGCPIRLRGGRMSHPLAGMADVPSACGGGRMSHPLAGRADVPNRLRGRADVPIRFWHGARILCSTFHPLCAYNSDDLPS